MTIGVIGDILLEISIQTIKTCALYDNYIDIFGLKVLFSGILQRDVMSLCKPAKYEKKNMI